MIYCIRETGGQHFYLLDLDDPRFRERQNMWDWDQGHLQYSLYDRLCIVSRFMLDHDLKNERPEIIRKNTGLDFSAPKTHSPWRQYARVYKLCLIASEVNQEAKPTDIAKLLAAPGTVTCDEYMHFLLQATTHPSPALRGWQNVDQIRYPLLFALKYVLAKLSCETKEETSFNEIISAYANSGFDGSESDEEFIGLMYEQQTRNSFTDLAGSKSMGAKERQSRESIKFISQISYLSVDRNNIVVSLGHKDASEIFCALNPVPINTNLSGDETIQHIAHHFRDGSTQDFFSYPNSTISSEIDSGFMEGGKSKQSHIVIERNSKLRKQYFQINPNGICQACSLDTSTKYPWTERILDLHHILPLSSGTRVDAQTGTSLEDLVAVCPTCHRAIHRYYDKYLRDNCKSDFATAQESCQIYNEAIRNIR